MSERQQDAWTTIRFEEVAIAAFACLRHDFGFRVVESAPQVVIFGRDEVVIEVLHQSDSFEVSVRVWRRSGAEMIGVPEKFAVWGIARLANDSSVSALATAQASNAESVASVLAVVADLLAQHGKPAIRGDERFYESLRELQLAESQRFLADSAAARLRDEVDTAWRSRDYAKVVNLFKKHGGELSRAENAKFAYAERKLRDS